MTNNARFALAYLITFRAYGTWLHGDRRGSVDQTHNIYGTPKLPPNPQRQEYERRLLKCPPVMLDAKRRAAVENGIRETCKIRNWTLWAFNIRTNHVHSVVSGKEDSKKVRATLKANATRKLRETGCWMNGFSPWSERGSRKHLWIEEELVAAITYVLYDQGEPLP